MIHVFIIIMIFNNQKGAQCQECWEGFMPRNEKSYWIVRKSLCTCNNKKIQCEVFTPSINGYDVFSIQRKSENDNSRTFYCRNIYTSKIKVFTTEFYMTNNDFVKISPTELEKTRTKQCTNFSLVCGDSTGSLAAKSFYYCEVSLVIMPPRAFLYINYENEVYMYFYPPEIELHIKFTLITPSVRNNTGNLRYYLYPPYKVKVICFKYVAMIIKEYKGQSCYTLNDTFFVPVIIPNSKYVDVSIDALVGCYRDPVYNLINIEPVVTVYGLATTYYTVLNKSLIVISATLDLRKKTMRIRCTLYYRYSIRDYTIIAAANFTIDPLLNVYMLQYEIYNLSVYFSFKERRYDTVCTPIGTSCCHTYSPFITFNIALPGGTYYMVCQMIGFDQRENVTLITSHAQSYANITPKTKVLYYMKYNSTCTLEPYRVKPSHIIMYVSHLDNSQYSRIDSTIVFIKNLTILGKYICVICGETLYKNKSQCYNLSADIAVSHTPIKDYYMTLYEDYHVEFNFKHQLDFFPAVCDCVNESYQLPMHKSHFLDLTHGNMIEGIIIFRCYVQDTVYYKDDSLFIYDGTISLHYVPNSSYFYYMYDKILLCKLLPDFIKIKDIAITGTHKTGVTTIGAALMVDTVITFEMHCLCVFCITRYKVNITKCFTLKASLELEFLPKQRLYFSWKERLLLSQFYNPLTKYSYNATCYPPSVSLIRAGFGFIQIDKFTPSRRFNFTCSIQALRLNAAKPLRVLYDFVFIFIFPNASDFYITKEAMEVDCEVYPSVVNIFLPDIKFININPPKFEYVSNRKIYIGGPINSSNVTICVTCGHYLLDNVTKCYNYYDGRIYAHIQPESLIIEYKLPHRITCRLEPPYLKLSKIMMGLVGLNLTDYTKFDDASISIDSTKEFQNKEICIFCGNKSFVNSTKCYKLITSSSDLLLKIILIALFTLLLLIAFYIHNYEVM